MLDSFFITINVWMTGSLSLALLGCFLWGLVSIMFSPCHLASIPLMIGYVAGQGRLMEGKEAAGYAGVFSLGLFSSIAIVGVVCALLGRLLGDISPYWGIPIGALFVYLGIDLMGVSVCKLPSFGQSKLRLRGLSGALILGLSYGILSGACTFGFIAPILAIVTVQEQIAQGLLLLVVFAFGHCLPIAIAGSSAALAQRLVHAKGMEKATVWGRRIAGGLVAAIGIYFVVNPFV